MKKILTISFVLACTMWMFSQTSGSQSSTQGAGDQTIVRGCLNGSGGNYTLTDQSGTTYQLTGSTAKLGDHVGHTVQITGTKTSASASTGGSRTSTTPSSAGGTNVQPTLDVTSMKHISDSCSPGK